MKKRIGTVSYNMYCNFTNYGSALQTWALHQAIKKVAGDTVEPVLVDYCPDILQDKDPLNPFANMWDKDEESQRMCELTMPAIRENYYKFNRFYRERFTRTKGKYTSQNFNAIMEKEKLDGFVCGSDTIFCIDEFGFDDGYYANYDCMRGKSVSYAASFGDSHFTEESYKTLHALLRNFKAIGIRENQMVPYVKSHMEVPVARTIDPTLLLTREDYDVIAEKRLVEGKYLLLYARRYNSEMEAYAERLAEEKGWQIVEISLRAENAKKPHRIMYYAAGVEEFLSLTKYAECVVTNSFHGVIVSAQYGRSFCVFCREQADTKITELLQLFGVSDECMADWNNRNMCSSGGGSLHECLEKARKNSLDFLKMELDSCF